MKETLRPNWSSSLLLSEGKKGVDWLIWAVAFMAAVKNQCESQPEFFLKMTAKKNNSRKSKIIIPAFISPITPPAKKPLESSGCGVVQIHSTPPATKVTPEWSGQ